METLKTKVKKVREILNTYYYPVGIKIIRDETSSWNGSFKEISDDKRFCKYVRLAAQGESFVITNNDKLECKTPYFCLGFKEPKYANFEPRIKPAITKAVLIAPLIKFTQDVDSVVFIINAKQAMLLTDALRRILNKKVESSFGASMSVCGEAVAQSIVTNSPNFSVLCFGARVFSGYKDDELVLGIPYSLFYDFYKQLKKIEILQKLELELKNGEVK
ncbi:MAG: DUF169 domain-containing protein [Candidatus Helarchaeota archaeon]